MNNPAVVCFLSSQTCPHIPDGESLSGNTFCLMAGGMLRATGDFLSKEIDEVVKRMYVSDSEGSDDNEASIRSDAKTYRAAESIFVLRRFFKKCEM